MKIVIIIGTTKESYTNQRIAGIITASMMNKEIGIDEINVRLINLAELPFDYIHTFLTPNFTFREEFEEPIVEADKIFIICPEYNRSIPGPLKTFIDGSGWPSFFKDKQIYSIVAAGGIGDMCTLNHLEDVMKFMSADVKDGILLRNTMTKINDIETESIIKNFTLNAIQN